MDDDPLSPPRDIVKVVLLGDSGVGKSSLVQQYVYNHFEKRTEPTVGAGFVAKDFDVPQTGRRIKFQIWDTAGQEKYRSLAPMFYRQAQVAVIVYDITKSETYKAVQYWERELRNFGPEDILLVVCANKSDLESRRDVDSNAASSYAEDLGALFFETSAKTKRGVSDMFAQIGSAVRPPVVKGFASEEQVDLRERQAGRRAASGGGCSC